MGHGRHHHHRARCDGAVLRWTRHGQDAGRECDRERARHGPLSRRSVAHHVEVDRRDRTEPREAVRRRRRRHAIVLFDEADSLFSKRTEVKSSVDRYANLEVNFLLQRLDTFEGIAILTTNFGTSIDAAFKRRLSFRLTFPFPDEEAREGLWRSHLPAALPTSGTFDLGDLSRRYRLSGGYIRNAVLRAAFLAAEEHSTLTQDHLERAIKAEFREIGKIAESGVLE